MMTIKALNVKRIFGIFLIFHLSYCLQGQSDNNMGLTPFLDSLIKDYYNSTYEYFDSSPRFNLSPWVVSVTIDNINSSNDSGIDLIIESLWSYSQILDKDRGTIMGFFSINDSINVIIYLPVNGLFFPQAEEFELFLKRIHPRFKEGEYDGFITVPGGVIQQPSYGRWTGLNITYLYRLRDLMNITAENQISLLNSYKMIEKMTVNEYTQFTESIVYELLTDHNTYKVVRKSQADHEIGNLMRRFRLRR